MCRPAGVVDTPNEQVPVRGQELANRPSRYTEGGFWKYATVTVTSAFAP